MNGKQKFKDFYERKRMAFFCRFSKDIKVDSELFKIYETKKIKPKLKNAIEVRRTVYDESKSMDCIPKNMITIIYKFLGYKVQGNLKPNNKRLLYNKGRNHGKGQLYRKLK